MKSRQNKVLVITYYWPPSGGPGVQRWLKNVKYLDEMGLDVHVHTPENPESPSIDETLINEVPKSVTVIKRKILEPYSIYNFIKGNKTKADHSSFLNKKDASIIQKLAVWVRSNLLIPDARVFWVKPSVKFLSKYIIENNIDTVITTGPPHSMHLIGRGIKKKLKDIKWISDFRDPWTFIDFFDKLELSDNALKKHKQLEKAIIDESDLRVTVSPSWKRIYEDQYNKEFNLIYNGFDSKDFIDKEYNLPAKFTIAHVGTMNQDRNPSAFWTVLGDLLKETPSLHGNLELCLKGKVYPEVFIELKNNNIPYTHETYVSHEEAIATTCSSHLLLLPVNNTNSLNELGHIPGKFFEYLAAGRPILCFGNQESDIKDIIERYNNSIFIDYKDISTSKDKIKKMIEAVATLTTSRPTLNIPFERKSAAKDYFELITNS